MINKNYIQTIMKLRSMLCMAIGLALSFHVSAQSEYPDVVSVTVLQEDSDGKPDVTDYQIRIDFNSLHDLKKIALDLGSSDKAKDVLSLKGEIYSADRKTYLLIAGQSYVFNRYSVTIPVNVAKKDAGRWKFFFASAQDAHGRNSKQRVFPKNK